MDCTVPLMFQSKYSFKIGDWDLAFILVHVKYRTYTESFPPTVECKDYCVPGE